MNHLKVNNEIFFTVNNNIKYKYNYNSSCAQNGLTKRGKSSYASWV